MNQRLKKIAYAMLVFSIVFGTQALSAAPAYAVAIGQQCGGSDGNCDGDAVCDTSQTPSKCVANENTANGGGTVSTGGACTRDGDCSGNLACISNRCQIDPSLEDRGTAAAGGACGQIAGITGTVDCSGDQTCQIPTGQTQGTCVGATGNTTSANSNSAAVSNCGSSIGGFVSLSCIPGFADAESQGGLTKFFQYLYDLCIGIAVIIAVLKISQAGVMYMTSQGNESTITDAKHIIGASLTGLALILSPILILNTINPGINNFDALTNDATSLTVSPTASNQQQQSLSPAQQQQQLLNTTGTLTLCNGSDCSAAKGQCAGNNAVGGNNAASVVCVTSGGSIDPNGTTLLSGALTGYSCKTPGEQVEVQCQSAAALQTGY